MPLNTRTPSHSSYTNLRSGWLYTYTAWDHYKPKVCLSSNLDAKIAPLPSLENHEDKAQTSRPASQLSAQSWNHVERERERERERVLEAGLHERYSLERYINYYKIFNLLCPYEYLPTLLPRLKVTDRVYTDENITTYRR